MSTDVCKNLSTSIIKKQVVAFTGLFFCLFLFGHLAGNSLILFSPKAFNQYAHALTSNPTIYLIEAIMLVLFLLHVGLAFRLTWANRKARGQRYFLKQNTGRGATFVSDTMPITGILIFIFLVLHILKLKFGPVYEITYDGVTIRDLYKTVVLYFKNPLNVAFYEAAMVVVGLHVSHGLWSALQTFGLNHPRYNGFFRKFSIFYAVIITVGFMTLPIYCYLKGE
jgi:succinate dehydrogenase / fumarate reductase cytochrome b subunit